MRWFGLASLLVVSACSADNPEFDGEVGPTPMRGTEGEEGGESSSTSSPTSGLVTTDSATSPAGTSDDSAGTGTSGFESESGFLESSGGNACTDEPDARIKILLSQGGSPLEADCTRFEVYGDVVVDEDGGALHVSDCAGECPCAKTIDAVYDLDFDEPGVVPDVYGGCRRVVVWSSEGEASCEWAAFSIEPFEGAPFVIGSNRLVPELPSLPETPSFGEGEECGLRGCNDGVAHPGLYALAVDGINVWPDDPATEVMLGDVPYMLDNRMSHINEWCEQKVSWWAQIR